MLGRAAEYGQSGRPPENLENNNVTDFWDEGAMQLSGYTKTEMPIEEVASAELAEVTLCATPEELRSMAEYFLFCASEMERMGTEYSHVHLADRSKEFEEAPHLTVFRLS